MKQSLGILIMLIGIACGDSANLLIPAVMIGAGFMIYKWGERHV